MKTLSIFLVLLFLLPFYKGRAQEVISPAGAHGTSASVQLSWTLGQPVVETFTGSSFILTQGFHQGRLTITSTDPSALKGMDIRVFPNPANSGITLSAENGFAPGLQMILADSEGKVLLSEKVNNSSGRIDLQSFSSGVYTLRIVHPAKSGSQTFKIIKH